MRANFDFGPGSDSEQDDEPSHPPTPKGFHSTMALIAATVATHTNGGVADPGLAIANGLENHDEHSPTDKRITFGPPHAMEESGRRKVSFPMGGRMASTDFFHQFGRKIIRTHTHINIKRSRLIHIFYVVALPAYTLFGAWMFQILDRDFDNEAISNYTKRCNETRNHTINQLKINCSTVLFTECEDMILSAIETVDNCLRLWHDSHHRPTHSLGDYANAVIYATSIYTTIGYGNIAADTFGARMATIWYAIFGIPLFFAFLKDQGQLFSVVFMKSWKLMKHAANGCKKTSHPHLLHEHEQGNFHEQGTETDNNNILAVLHGHPNVSVNVQPPSLGSSSLVSRATSPNNMSKSSTTEGPHLEPPHLQHNPLDSMGSNVNRKRQVHEQRKVFIWAVIFLLIYLFLGSLLLMAMEPTWDLFTSIYFVFQSIALIGFGDVFPKKPSVVLINFFFIVIGIILFGMCYFILQEEIRQKAFAASHKLRISLQKRRLSRAIHTKARGQANDSSIANRVPQARWRCMGRKESVDPGNLDVFQDLPPIPEPPDITVLSCGLGSSADGPSGIAPKAEMEDVKTPRHPDCQILPDTQYFLHLPT